MGFRRVARNIRLALLALTAVASGAMCGSATAGPRNVLLLIADDLGLEASQLYPVRPNVSTTPIAVPVPNLEKLAAKGVLFNSAWAAPTCSPSRAMMMTGRYPFRTGIGGPILVPENDPQRRFPQLSTTEVSLAEAFKATAAGRSYEMTLIGKWHLSWGARSIIQQGWDYFVGPDPTQLGGALKDYHRWTKVRSDGPTVTSTTYNTTDLVDEAIAAMDRAAEHGRPYLIWLGFNAPHFPYHKPPNALHTRDHLPATGAAKRDYYRAMIEALDTEIGRLLRHVDLADTTVIFLGDNGTPEEVQADAPAGLHGKWSIYEGGVRVPFLVAGAGVVAPGRSSSALANAVDLFPTILELAGLPARPDGLAAVRTDGVSLLPVIENSASAVRSHSYAENFTWSYNGNFQRGIRDDRYVLIEREGTTNQVPSASPRRELYDLRKDPLQRTNLLARTLTAFERSRLFWLDFRLDALLSTR
jgi:arylsulfatase A-like enzyme